MTEYLSRDDFDYMWSMMMQKLDNLEKRVKELEAQRVGV